jgi:hypothetical protein
LQGVEWGCADREVLLHAAQMEDRGCPECFADVQHDFMSLHMLPKVCEHLQQFFSSARVAASLSES